ncbi:hypothetical protein E3N88_38665 [Mikania micrantha]|uniref:Uncharacterized protein n=1 Tax=Mikania micrantha TaxID=192012 RepID=A0A5N6LUL8_9ASTR|nr:hypothetical protein E3N88_38665 [Mikania micrantha]
MLVSLRLFNPAILMTTPHGRCVSLFWWTMTFKGGEWQQKNYSPTNTRSLTYEAFVNFWSSWETVFRIEVWPAIFICETEAEFNFQSSMLDFDSGAPPEKAWRRKLNSHTDCSWYTIVVICKGRGLSWKVGEHGERKGTSLPSFHMGAVESNLMMVNEASDGDANADVIRSPWILLVSVYLAMELSDSLICIFRDCGRGAITESVQYFIGTSITVKQMCLRVQFTWSYLEQTVSWVYITETDY